MSAGQAERISTYPLPAEEFLVVYNVLVDQPEEMTEKDLKFTVNSLGLVLEPDKTMPKTKRDYMEYIQRKFASHLPEEMAQYSKKLWKKKSTPARTSRGKSVFVSPGRPSSPKRKSSYAEDKISPAMAGVGLLLWLAWNGKKFQFSAEETLDIAEKLFAEDEVRLPAPLPYIFIAREEGKRMVENGGLIYNKEYEEDGSLKFSTITTYSFYPNSKSEKKSWVAAQAAQKPFPSQILEEGQTFACSLFYDFSQGKSPKEINRENLYKLSNGEDPEYFLVFYRPEKKRLAIYYSITEKYFYPRVYLKIKTYPYVGSFFVLPEKERKRNLAVSSICFQRRETLNYIYCEENFLCFKAEAKLVDFTQTREGKEIISTARDVNEKVYILKKREEYDCTGNYFEYLKKLEKKESFSLTDLIKKIFSAHKTKVTESYTVVPKKIKRLSYVADPKKVLILEDENFPEKILSNRSAYDWLLLDSEGKVIPSYFPLSNASGYQLVFYNQKDKSVGVYHLEYNSREEDKSDEYYVLKKSYRNVKEFFVGNSTLTNRTLQYCTYQYLETNVMFRLGDSLNYVVYEEGYLGEFTAENKIISFFCPLSRNSVTEPYAIDEKYNLYLLAKWPMPLIIFDVGLDYEDMMDPPDEDWSAMCEDFVFDAKKGEFSVEIAGEKIVKRAKEIEFEDFEISD